MNIYLAYYSNIWPFANQDILVHFPNGKYMIQSPVGTGKSFLFFDGIIYGLYKYSDRNIVNVNCKQWDIYIVFEIDDNIYMIHRSISTTATNAADSSKLSESTKSKLYIYDHDKSEYHNNINKKLPDQIITKTSNISDYININERKAFDFKNESDLNSQLKELLPLREVFINRYMFMQNSEDIFGVQEAERLKIFKNIFGLLDIDKIKEDLSGRAREIKWMIIAKKNNDTHNQNFSKYISDLLVLHNQINNIGEVNKLPKLSKINNWIEENQMFIEKMTMDKLDINHLTIEQETYDILSQIKNIHQDFLSQKQVIESQISTNISELKTLKSYIYSNINNINILINKIWELSPQKLDDLKNKKNEIINEKEKLQKEYITKATSKNIFVNSREELIEYINIKIQKGKDLKFELSENQNKLDLLILNQKNLVIQKDNIINSQSQKSKFLIENQISKLQNQIENLQNQIINNNNILAEKINDTKLLTSELNWLQDTLKNQNKFFCTKIDAECPFIYQINKNAIDKTTLLINNTNQKISQNNIYILELWDKNIELWKQISNIQKQILDWKLDLAEEDKSEYTNYLDKIITQITNLDFENQNNILNNNIKEINDQIWMAMTELIDLDFGSIQNANNEINLINKDISWLDENINDLQMQIDNSQNTQKEIDQLLTSQNIHNSKILELENNYDILTKKLEIVNSEITNINISNIISYEKIISNISTNIDKIRYIYTQYQDDIILVKKLEQEEKIVKDLVNIFGKELTLLILQEFLPSLESSINEFLSKIVDYEVRFTIREWGEKMEINIKNGWVFREVKSLSGGQKAILRLSWIFAIARRSHNKFLFLDETINNLDSDNISSVAEMIKDFVLQNDIKFYSITHSVQIQSMAIRDQVINVRDSLYD